MVSGKGIIEAFASSQLEFKVTRFNWTKKYFPQLTDLSFNFIFKGQKYSGRGSDTNEETAFLKASMEAIERCVCSHYKIHTSGVAAHFNYDSAITNAQSELIERDSALCHYLTRFPIKEIECMDSTIKSSVQEFKKNNVKIQFFKMEQSQNLFPVVSIATGAKLPTPFGMILGIGAKCSINESLSSAYGECSRNVAFALNTCKLESFDQSSFNKAPSLPHSHFKFALHKDTPMLLEDFIKYSEYQQSNKSVPIFSDFQFESLDSTFLKLKLEKLFVVKATNPFLQSMFYGLTTSEKINLKRLSEFSGKTLTFEDVFKLPHIFG